MALREAAVAGSFYPGEREKLLKTLNSLFKGIPEQEKSNYVISPHAGYAYSGKTAAHSFKALKQAETFAILGPNHTGIGEPISASNASFWETPLGKVQVDEKAREQLLELLGIEADETAHIQEHSIEVQIPFLQHQFKEFKILPITISEHNFSELEKLGKALSKLQGNLSFIASGDFTHFEPLEKAREKDLEAIKKIKEMDAKGFYNEVVSKNLSICGLAPITALMQCLKEKGIKKGKLLKYDTSATSTKDKANVVGYASIAFY